MSKTRGCIEVTDGGLSSSARDRGDQTPAAPTTDCNRAGRASQGNIPQVPPQRNQAYDTSSLRHTRPGGVFGPGPFARHRSSMSRGCRSLNGVRSAFDSFFNKLASIARRALHPGRRTPQQQGGFGKVRRECSHSQCDRQVHPKLNCFPSCREQLLSQRHVVSKNLFQATYVNCILKTSTEIVANSNG
jgi:hypothetical protein